MPPAVAQVPPPGFDVLAAGRSTTRIRLNEKGPSDVLQVRFQIPPGGDTGWHSHPGPVIVVLKAGALTEFHDNGCVSVHPAGSVFFERAGVVHRAVNQTGQMVDAYATFILPPGGQPLQTAPDPGNKPCSRDHDEDED
jgi:quercetin dioxygenase-like cupin family protein